MEQIHKGLLLGAQAALVRVDQHIPHLLALGRALLQHQMVLLQCPAGHGRCPHVGRGQPLQDRELAAPLIHMDTALRVDMPAHTVAALLAGQLEIIVEDLHILVQLRQVADLLPGQRAVPVGQQGGKKLLVGHGTPDPATASYAMFDYMLKAEGHPEYHVGTVEGYPEYEDALRLLKNGKSKTLTLAPLMFVAGDHAKNDIAGEWKENLEKQGYKVNLYLKGLGENPTVQQLFIQHARFAAGHKAVDMATRKKGYMQGK